MSARFQLRIQRYGWDKASAHYERLWGQQVAPAQRMALDMADLQPGERVLDVACGPGSITFAAADLVGPRGSVLGSDLSGRMVDMARERGAAGGYANVAFERMGAEDAGLEDAAFDAALCSLGLMYTSDPAAALGRMRDALRPGGRVVASVWGARAHCGWADIFPIVDARVESEVCPLFFQLGTGDSLSRAFRDAGFEKVALRRIQVQLDYDSAESAVGAAFAGGPVALAYSRFSDEVRVAAEQEYLHSIEPFRQGNGYSIPGEYVAVAGVRPGA
ncbi:MAG: methyltransferase domain-containing protein [Bryobacterales bacterium]|nr:methyltransferase domain-containing protein [Bryobacterales bacterium]